MSLSHTDGLPCDGPPAQTEAVPPPRLLDRVRSEVRLRHYSLRTEETYVDWVKRFIFYHNKRHPAEMGLTEVEAFLTHLALERHVASATQNQAKSALLFLYRNVLDMKLPWLAGVVQAKPSQRLPVVLSTGEVRKLLEQMSGVTAPAGQGSRFRPEGGAGPVRKGRQGSGDHVARVPGNVAPKTPGQDPGDP